MIADGGPYRETTYRLAGETPRKVPASLRVVMLTGGWMGLIGWMVCGIGGIMAGIFIPMSDLGALFTFRGELVQVPGQIVSVRSTSATENKRRIWSLSYEFVDADGTPRSGRSYAKHIPPVPGRRVTIEYPKGRPSVSRIQGARTRPFHPAVAFTAIPVLVGLPFIVLGFLRGRRNLHLLRYGKLTTGRRLTSTPTNVQINKRRVYRITFEFEADGQKHTAEARTHETEKLADAAEPLLYHPLDATRATLLDHLPGAPRIENGQFAPVRGGAVVLALLVPVLAIAGATLAWTLTSLAF